jgi:hypothetical protein
VPLWNNQIFNGGATGNSRPKFGFPEYFASPVVANVTANTANTIGVSANAYANTYGPATWDGKGGPGHAGWINIRIGKGYIAAIDSILNAGNNIANGSYAVIYGGGGANANIQVTSVTGNGVYGNVTSVVLRSGGDGYNTAVNGANTGTFGSMNVTVRRSGTGANAHISVIMGGRAGRVEAETIVAMGSMTGNDDAANTFFVPNATPL